MTRIPLAAGVAAALAVTLSACAGSPAATSSAAPRATAPATPASAVSSAPAAAPATPAAVPSAGATLTTISNGDMVTRVISNPLGIGFDVLNGDLTSYNAAGHQLADIPASAYSPDCGAADVITPNGRILLTEQVNQVPAAGINPATASMTLTAWNATTGAKLWSSLVIPNNTSMGDCDAETLAGDLEGVSATYDGRWAAFSYFNVTAGIDLSSGKVYSNPNVIGVVGDWLVTQAGAQSEGNNDTNPDVITLPGSWQQLGSTSSVLNLASQNAYGDNLAPAGATDATGTDAGPSSGDPSASVTPDGKTLITDSGDANNNQIRAYSLPSLSPLWTSPTTGNVAAVSQSTIIVTSSVSNNGNENIMGLSAATGARLWTVNVDESAVPCDLTSTQLLVMDNDQLATLDAATGKQLSYGNDTWADSGGSPSCPTLLESGLSGVGWNTQQVSQLMAP